MTTRAVLGVLVAMCLSIVPACAGEPALSVDAGPDQVLCFPATDLTLFGRASDGNQLVGVRWSVVSGPGPVKFSA